MPHVPAQARNFVGSPAGHRHPSAPLVDHGRGYVWRTAVIDRKQSPAPRPARQPRQPEATSQESAQKWAAQNKAGETHRQEIPHLSRHHVATMSRSEGIRAHRVAVSPLSPLEFSRRRDSAWQTYDMAHKGLRLRPRHDVRAPCTVGELDTRGMRGGDRSFAAPPRPYPSTNAYACACACLATCPCRSSFPIDAPAIGQVLTRKQRTGTATTALQAALLVPATAPAIAQSCPVEAGCRSCKALPMAHP